MRKVHRLIPAVALAMAAGRASAQLLYEPFNYTIGPSPDDRLDDRSTPPTSLSNPMNGAPWATMGTTTDYITLAPGSLSPTFTTGTPTAQGNSVTFAGLGNNNRVGIFNPSTTGAANINGPTITSGKAWYSIVLNVTDLSTSNTSGVFIGGFNTLTGDATSGPTVIGTRIYIRRDLTDGTKYNIGTGKNPASLPLATWDSTPLDINTNQYIVGSYEIIPTFANDDIANLWINPASSTLGKGTAPPATLANVNEGSNDLNVAGVPKVSSFVMRQTLPATLILDELRVDTSWAQVTQPAGTAWNNVGSGNWSDGTNWAGGVAPSGAETFAVLGNVATSNANVALTANQTVSTITFENPTNGYTISDAGGHLILDAGVDGESGLHVHSSSHQINAGIELHNFLGINTASTTMLTIMGDISGAHAIRKAGAGALWLGGNNTFSGGFAILGGTVNLQGFNTLGTGPVTIDKATIKLQNGYNVPTRHITINDGGATFESNGFTGIFGELTSNAGSLVKTGVGGIEFAHIRGGNITVTHGLLSITKNGGASGVSRTTGLALSNSPGAVGRFNLNDNKLILNGPSAGSATGGVYNGVQGQVQSGLNGGTWDGPGIITLEPDAVNNLTTIAVATGAQARGLGATDTDIFAGQTISGTSVLVMYTYAGDLNLDGQINADDYASIDFNANTAGAEGYYNGDINYDGAINADDYAAIDFNNNAQGAPFFAGGNLESVTTVPEPAACGFAVIGALLLARRRRHR